MEVSQEHTRIQVDHLDEDKPIPGQEYALFSFLSPEGILNCKIRALKFRGAFPTQEAAEAYCKRLEETDKYFKIFVGESGKWLEFNPTVENVEREATSNKKYQEFLDAQREQRSKKLNELAGKYKETIDKKDKGMKDRITENKKTCAAENICDKSTELPMPPQQHTKSTVHHGSGNLSKIREKMKQTLAERVNKTKLDAQLPVSGEVTENNKCQTEATSTTGSVEDNIAAIKKLMQNMKVKETTESTESTESTETTNNDSENTNNVI